MWFRKSSPRDAGVPTAADNRIATASQTAVWPRARAAPPPSEFDEMYEYLLSAFPDSDDEPPETSLENPAGAAFSRDEEIARAEPASPSNNDFDVSSRSASERRAAYEAEVVTLLRRKLRLVCVLTLIILPLFNLFHTHFTPQDYKELLIAYCSLGALCIFTFVLAKRLKTLRALRFLTLLAYALFCFKASMALSLAGDANPTFLVGSYNHIVLSLLLLPLCAWECLAIGGIALAALSFSAWWVLMPQHSALYYSHIFITSLTMTWVLTIAHFQNATRRDAFNATFDLAKSAAKLRDLTFRDPLTGGYNRRYLEETLESEITRATRYGRPLSVVMFDLDDFKNINDTCGHGTGDEVLRAVWRATMKVVRGNDTAARYGGDEFSIVLPESDEAAARVLATRLQKSVSAELQERFGADTLAGNTTLSIGITTARMKNALPVQELLDNADKFLYAAKRAGKNIIMS